MKSLFALAYTILICTSGFSQKPYAGKSITLLELRDYVVKEGLRDVFIDSFKVFIEDSQNVRKNYVLGKYTVEGADDRFFWLRGYENMESRRNAMTDFYTSEYWKKTSHISAAMLLNYHNVHLLKPMNVNTGDTSIRFDPLWFDQPKGITVIDFYTGNHERDKMLQFFQTIYSPAMTKAGGTQTSYWIASHETNSYPELPVFQDKELLVSIAFYKSKDEYSQMLGKIPKEITEQLERNVSVHSKLILHPTK